MTFAEYWKTIEAQNPQMRDAKAMRIGIESFRKSLRLAFEAGEREASDKGKCLVGELKQMLGMKE